MALACLPVYTKLEAKDIIHLLQQHLRSFTTDALMVVGFSQSDLWDIQQSPIVCFISKGAMQMLLETTVFVKQHHAHVICIFLKIIEVIVKPLLGVNE